MSSLVKSPALTPAKVRDVLIAVGDDREEFDRDEPSLRDKMWT